MEGTDVYNVLNRIRATVLYHANSVTTSSTFLELGGLLSRGFVEDRGLNQTRQYSDQTDKKYDIWHRIFLDHVDIHDRASRPNHYGPVLFELELNVLLRLPSGAEVCVTKKNPTNWTPSEPDNERWFQSAEELAQGIRFGDFGKMLVIQTPSGKLDFPSRRARIKLDDPQRQVLSGKDGYTYAENRLKEAAKTGQIAASIDRRECYNGCICLQKYARYSTGEFDRHFA